MEDEAGLDEKIIAVPSSRLTKRYEAVKTYRDLPDITVQQVQHFFEHYKDLEAEKWAKVTRWGGVEDARRLTPGPKMRRPINICRTPQNSPSSFRDGPKGRARNPEP
jgi:hypothetical protein